MPVLKDIFVVPCGWLLVAVRFHTNCVAMLMCSNGHFFAVTLGEFANFAAYAFAPATLVTPLGALSVLVR